MMVSMPCVFDPAGCDALVNHIGRQEEELPGRNRRADDSDDDQQHGRGNAAEPVSG